MKKQAWMTTQTKRPRVRPEKLRKTKSSNKEFQQVRLWWTYCMNHLLRIRFDIWSDLSRSVWLTWQYFWDWKETLGAHGHVGWKYDYRESSAWQQTSAIFPEEGRYSSKRSDWIWLLSSDSLSPEGSRSLHTRWNKTPHNANDVKKSTLFYILKDRKYWFKERIQAYNEGIINTKILIALKGMKYHESIMAFLKIL